MARELDREDTLTEGVLPELLVRPTGHPKQDARHVGQRHLGKADKRQQGLLRRGTAEAPAGSAAVPEIPADISPVPGIEEQYRAGCRIRGARRLSDGESRPHRT